MLQTPKISIITPSLNNGRYVGAFIESILSQTEPDFELIIIDDASTDNNLAVIESYDDPRIKIIRHRYRQGIMAGFNHGFAQAAAPIVAKIDSDDIAEPHYISRILETFAANPDAGVVYVALSCIDENGQPLPRQFRLNPNQKRLDCLRTIFYVRNCLTSPGMAFKKTALAPYLPLDLSILHYSDSYMHIQLLLHNEAVLLDEMLIKYRRQSFKSAQNVSARNTVLHNRTALEVATQMNAFLHIDDTRLLMEIFGNSPILQAKVPANETIPFLLGLMALTSQKQPKKIWGYRTIAHFIAEQKNFDLVHELYGFDFQQFLNLLEESGIEIITNKSSIRLIRFLRKLYSPYDNLRRTMKAKRKVS